MQECSEYTGAYVGGNWTNFWTVSYSITFQAFKLSVNQGICHKDSHFMGKMLSNFDKDHTFAGSRLYIIISVKQALQH